MDRKRDDYHGFCRCHVSKVQAFNSLLSRFDLFQCETRDVISHDIVWHRCQIMHTFMSYISKSETRPAGNTENAIATLQSLGFFLSVLGEEDAGERILTIEYVSMQKQ